MNGRGWAVLALVAALLLTAATAPAGPGPDELTPVQNAWRDEIVYMVMTDRFANGDLSNDKPSRPGDPRAFHGGDFQGLIDKLPYLQELGVTAIWITPVVQNQAGGYHGYWATDLAEVEPHLGTWEKLRELSDEAHAAGIKLILDIVVNHTGPQHPWVWNPEYDGWFHPPSDINWGSQTSIENGWLAGLPDWNTEHPGVQQYLLAMSRLWLEQSGADAVRVDTARHAPLPFWRDVYVPAMRAVDERFWAVGEVWDTQRYDYLGRYQEAGLDAVLDFPLYAAVTEVFGHDGPIGKLTGMHNLSERLLPRPSQLVGFIDNHDVTRFVTDAAPPQIARLHLALTFLLTYKDIPMLYYGTEIALEGGADPDNRRDMPWAADGGKPERNPETWDLVQRLIALRKEHEPLRRGTYTELYEDGRTLVFARQHNGHVVMTVLNNQDDPFAEAVPVAGLGLADGTHLRDELSGQQATVADGVLKPETPARAGQIWIVETATAAPASQPLTWAFAAGSAGLLAGFALLLVRRFAIGRHARVR